MKKVLSLLFVACALSAQATDYVKMMVFSDPHVLHKSLLPSNPSETFKSSLMLTEYSQDLFEEAIRVVGVEQPDVLLIPGDLALNGDSISLRYVAEQLNQLTQEKGVRVFIIPGNHDINEPTAKSYSAIESKGISLERFLEFYHNCGYAEAVEIAKDKISYRANLSDSLALIAINSAMDNSAGHMSAGGITEETLAWVEEQAKAAMAEGRYPIAMTHHQMLSHFDQQTMIDVDHIANMNDAVLATPSLNEVQTRLLDAGITTIFTGHMHIQSIKDVRPSLEDKYGNLKPHSRALYDISTNCLSGYGAAIRTIIMEDGGFASLSSTELGDIEGLIAADRQAMAKARLQNMANSAFNKVTDLCKAELGSMAGGIVAPILQGLMEKHMLEDYTQLFANLSQGEEYSDPEAAQAFAKKCEDDFTKVDNAISGNVSVKALFSASSELKAKYDNAVQNGSEMLAQMVRSITYNCTDWGYDSSLYNRISDFAPTIAKQYILEKVPSGVDNENDDENDNHNDNHNGNVRKCLVNGQLIIECEGVRYDLLGERM